ncbi:MAG: hypothetical protein HOP35_15860 [Nitrospira sp.]|nr:hypothetical protein [Nitrospira sp.]
MEILSYPKHSFSDQKILVRQIADFLEPEYSPSHVVLDGGNYSDDATVLDEFRDFAFSWNRDRPKDRVPSHVLGLMNEDLCRNLIWLSRRALEEEEVLLVWIVAHELRHIYQGAKGFSSDALRRVSRDLWRQAEFRALPSSPLGVAELDAEIFAMQTASSILGPAPVTEFLERRLLPRCPRKSYALFLQRLEVACRGNDYQAVNRLS